MFWGNMGIWGSRGVPLGLNIEKAATVNFEVAFLAVAMEIFRICSLDSALAPPAPARYKSISSSTSLISLTLMISSSFRTS